MVATTGALDPHLRYCPQKSSCLHADLWNFITTILDLTSVSLPIKNKKGIPTTKSSVILKAASQLKTITINMASNFSSDAWKDPAASKHEAPPDISKGETSKLDGQHLYQTWAGPPAMSKPRIFEAQPEQSNPVPYTPDVDRPAELHRQIDTGMSGTTVNTESSFKDAQEALISRTRDGARGITGSQRNQDRVEKGGKPRGRPPKTQDQKDAKHAKAPQDRPRQRKNKAGPADPPEPNPKRNCEPKSQKPAKASKDLDDGSGNGRNDSWFKNFNARVKKGPNAFQPGQGGSLTARLAAAGALDWSPSELHRSTACHCKTSKAGDRILDHTCYLHAPNGVPLNGKWAPGYSLQAGVEPRPGALRELLGDGRPVADRIDSALYADVSNDKGSNESTADTSDSKDESAEQTAADSGYEAESSPEHSSSTAEPSSDATAPDFDCVESEK